MNKSFIEERDGFDNRLLLFLKKKSGIPFINIKRLKQKVWLLSSTYENWIAKEFSSESKLTIQIAFTKELVDNGFIRTYSFHPQRFIVDNRIFGLIQYIEPVSENNFHYGNDNHISDSLQLLAHFHDTTSKFTSSFKNEIPNFRQIGKWNRRLMDFYYSMNEHKLSPAYSYLQQFSRIGEWALNKLQDDELFFTSKPHCIIHGDLASHNFIKGKDGTLYLIDFDLISIAPSHIDLLQMCNRVLPALNWSSDRLFSLEQIRIYKETRPFLAALVFPTDIFREWNYFANSTAPERQRRWVFLEKLIFGQLKERMEFYRTMIEKVEAI
ncbi:phosphotransferase [Lederbergia citrea]|uniref:Phosphotransferase n=1 Tax=Lederbergia citrea TaxID=2833581 RepID=A0A942UJD2_9BACI|nr:phosphotransferase [Lederbergia citrea]MBS4176211.1 phosphotransferase [Lederbergia citrea]MBS4202771.1 phosphotransferase [Lederbergia citrea]MBS4222561.1 phosphotransferase [Lederbergia citrea]